MSENFFSIIVSKLTFLNIFKISLIDFWLTYCNFFSFLIRVNWDFIIALFIDLVFDWVDIIDFVIGLPFCLFPIFIVGMQRAGASTIPVDEFPIIPLECLIRLIKYFLPADLNPKSSL